MLLIIKYASVSIIPILLIANCGVAPRIASDPPRAQTPSEAVALFWAAASKGSEESAVAVASTPPDSFLRVCPPIVEATPSDKEFTLQLNTETKPENDKLQNEEPETPSLLSKENGYNFTLAGHFRLLKVMKRPFSEFEIQSVSIFEDEAAVVVGDRKYSADHMKNYVFLVRNNNEWRVVAVYSDSTLFLLLNSYYGTSQSCR